MASIIEPISVQERISALDILRGVAVLGILLMNIAGFGLPSEAYDNPSVAGGAEGPNLAFWLVNQVFFEGKMRCIFSMLFGAGSYLLVTRAERRGAGLLAADVYYRRTLWLIAIGLVHAYLIWFGDILFIYGVTGLALLPFRRMSARGLLICGGLCFLILTLASLVAATESARVCQKALEADAAEKAGKKLTEEQAAAQREWHTEGKPDPKELQKEVETHRKGYLANLQLRAGQVFEVQTDAFYRVLALDAGGAFFIGIALVKLGVLTAERSFSFYWKMLVVGYAVGLPFNAFTGWKWVQSGWDPVVMSRYIYSGLSFGRLSVALGHIALVMLIYKAGWFSSLTRRLTAVGRMALTNYLMQSIICTLIFNGYGFGLFGKLQRFQLLFVVIPIWISQLLASPIWLKYFQYGPFEWVWRSLTYWQKQPMRLGRPASISEGGNGPHLPTEIPSTTEPA